MSATVRATVSAPGRPDAADPGDAGPSVAAASAAPATPHPAPAVRPAMSSSRA